MRPVSCSCLTSSIRAAAIVASGQPPGVRRGRACEGDGAKQSARISRWHSPGGEEARVKGDKLGLTPYRDNVTLSMWRR